MPSPVTVSISVDAPTQRATCKIAGIQFDNSSQSFFTCGNQWSFLSLPWGVWENSLCSWSLLAPGGWLQTALETSCLLTVVPSEYHFAHPQPGLDALMPVLTMISQLTSINWVEDNSTESHLETQKRIKKSKLIFPVSPPWFTFSIVPLFLNKDIKNKRSECQQAEHLQKKLGNGGEKWIKRYGR